MQPLRPTQGIGRVALATVATALFLTAQACRAETEAEPEVGSGSETPAAEEAAGAAAGKESQDVAIQAIDAFIAKQDIDRGEEGWKTRLPEPPKVEFDPDARYRWVLHTNHGTIEVRLLPDAAPKHVSSTIYLTRLGFYDGVIFHRVIPGFMAQGGDPTGTGRGGPGYQYAGEFDPEARHDEPGTLSMANAGPGTDGSQFFLTFEETPWLDDKHTVFGRVAEGMDAVRELEKRGTRGGRPTERLVIERAEIRVES